jgi:hypothetical protein
MKRILLVIAIFCSSNAVFAQSELTLPFMEHVFQSSYLNPTVRPEHTISIGLPAMSSVYMQVIHNGFVPNSVLAKEGNTLVLNPQDLPGAMKNSNMIYANAGIEFFHLRFKVYHWDYWFAVRQNHEMSFFYPKDLFKLAAFGNYEFAGQTMDFSPLGFNMSLYREYTFGMATEVNEWAYGGRISLLQGLGNTYLKPKTLSIAVDDDMYALTADANGVLYTSGIPLDSANMPDISRYTEGFDMANYKENQLYQFLTRFRNPGVALSGGVSYKYDSRTKFTLSFSDLGFISWSDSTKNYLLKGSHTFSGVDGLADFLYGRGVNTDSIIDAALDNFSDDDFSDSYLTWLSPKIYLRADYQLARRTQLGLQLYSVINRKFYPAFTVGIQQGFGRVFSVLLTGSFNQRSFTNLGFGMVIKPGPFQIYLVADNYYSPVVDPLSFTNFNFRTGVNLVFGRPKKPQGLPYR